MLELGQPDQHNFKGITPERYFCTLPGKLPSGSPITWRITARGESTDSIRFACSIVSQRDQLSVDVYSWLCLDQQWYRRGETESARDSKITRVPLPIWPARGCRPSPTNYAGWPFQSESTAHDPVDVHQETL